MKRILSLGAGIQSSTLLLMSCRGDLPKLDAWIFADTQYEPPEVYTHLEWLKEESTKAGIPFYVVTAGNLRQDAIDFREHRKSGNGRFASIPFFVKNPDGSQGRIRRQCTKEYKIEPVERCLRRQILGLAPRQRTPKEPVIEHWFGISSDEPQRAKPPGRMVTVKKTVADLFGEREIEVKRWRPQLWQQHAYPLMGLRIHSNRQTAVFSVGGGGRGKTLNFTREDCIKWLKANFPNRNVPRSACICCPFRTNAEWRHMRDNDPESWQDAIIFDQEIRHAEALGKWRAPLSGEPYTHRQMVPLDQVDLDGIGESNGGGCGTLFDDQTARCGF